MHFLFMSEGVTCWFKMNEDICIISTLQGEWATYIYIYIYIVKGKRESNTTAEIDVSETDAIV